MYDVCVVGGGVAGLAAAHTLASSGYSVILLEARPRLGGRVWTPFELVPAGLRLQGADIDLGASYIHGCVPKHPVVELLGGAAAARAAIEIDWDRGVLVDTAGRAIPPAASAAAERARLRAYGAARRARGVSLGAAYAAAGLQLGDAVVAAVVSSLHEYEYAADIDAMDSVAQDEDDEIDGPDSLPPAGMGAVVAALAPASGAQYEVRLNTPTTSITHSPAGAAATTAAGAVVGARACVVAVPPFCLARGVPSLTPPLPQGGAAAAAFGAGGVLAKLILAFPRRCWGSSASVFTVAAGSGVESLPPPRGGGRGWVARQMLCLWMCPAAARGAAASEPHTLVGFACGDAGRALEAMSDDEAVAVAMPRLCAALGLPPGGLPAPAAVLRTRWSLDQWALASYSCPLVGSAPSRHAAAGAAAPPLFFCGEHTHAKYPSTVHGALLSGRRAAGEVAAFLRHPGGRAGGGGPAPPVGGGGGGGGGGRALTLKEVEGMDWVDLPPAQRAAAAALGYSQRLWDRGGKAAVDDLDWADLSAAQREAAAVLGYTQRSWDR